MTNSHDKAAEDAASHGMKLHDPEYLDFVERIASLRRMSIGQMAEMNGTSVKTLRLYQEKGLFEPIEVDPDTGYRYYSLNQALTLDRILRYQFMGFSLNEIKFILENEGSAEDLIPMFHERLHAIRNQLLDLEIAKSNCMRYLTSVITGWHPAATNDFVLEWQPERYRLDFGLPHGSYELPTHYTESNSLVWCYVLRTARRSIIERGIPVSLFDNVYDIVSKDDLAAGNLVVSKACVFIEEKIAAQLEDVVVMPAGMYLTYTYDTWSLEDGRAAERANLERMLAYIKEHGLMVRGDYFGEGNVDHFIAPDAPDTTFVKMNIPVVTA